jgi:hypothetical protein
LLFAAICYRIYNMSIHLSFREHCWAHTSATSKI